MNLGVAAAMRKEEYMCWTCWLLFNWEASWSFGSAPARLAGLSP